MSDVISQTVHLPASPARVFHALMDSGQHGAFTGAPADISTEIGGAFAAHSGQITGRNLDLERDTRIVQAWRAEAWPQGVFSVVRFDLERADDGTKLTLTHAGVPSEAAPHIDAGWERMYWGPLRAFLTNED